MRWRWEKTGFFSGSGPVGGNLPDSGKRLAFSIVDNLSDDNAERVRFDDQPLGRLESQETIYKQNLVVLGLSKGELPRFDHGFKIFIILLYSHALG